MAMSPQTIKEIRALFMDYGGVLWLDFPDHMIDYYARAFLNDNKNQQFGWWKKLRELVTDDILLGETADEVLVPRKHV